MLALSALEQGYEVYVATDACVGVTAEAYERAIERMIERGATPISWIAFMRAPARLGAVRAKKPRLPGALVSSRARPMGNAARGHRPDRVARGGSARWLGSPYGLAPGGAGGVEN